MESHNRLHSDIRRVIDTRLQTLLPGLLAVKLRYVGMYVLQEPANFAQV